MDVEIDDARSTVRHAPGAEVTSRRGKMFVLRLALVFAGLVALSGCESFGRGVADAFLSQDDEDTRACEIRGGAFTGLEQSLARQEDARAAGVPASEINRTRVLMIHGIGEQIPGHSARLLDNLASELGLSVIESRTKEIQLVHPRDPGRSIGKIRVHRLFSEDMSREMLFFELTWSVIVEPEREILAFDQSNEQTFRRATFNNILKELVNSAVPDSMIYLGETRDDILISASQSICRMLSNDWDDIVSGQTEACDAASLRFAEALTRDDTFVITHSLGSRIFVDSMQRVVELSSGSEVLASTPQLAEAVRQKRWTVFMLANQLPLLQLGRRPPAVVNQIPQICLPGAPLNDTRFADRTTIVAFTDPNDILSYSIPPQFVDGFLDSRLCPAVTNVYINVAQVSSLFGLGDYAGLRQAHSDYDNDERVIAMIAHGVDSTGPAEVVSDRCTWTRTINNFGVAR